MSEKPKFQIPIEVREQLASQPPPAESEDEELKEISLRARRLTASSQADAVQRHLADREIRSAAQRELDNPVD